MTSADGNRRITLKNVTFDDVGTKNAAERVIAMAKKKIGGYVVTPNGNMAQNAAFDQNFANLIENAALVLPDGTAVTLAAALSGTPFTYGRAPGVELGEQVAALAAKEGLSLFLLGGKRKVAEEAAQKLTLRYPSLIIAGAHQGYGIKSDGVIRAVTESRADILYCCLGSPLQEQFAALLSPSLSVPILCLGGSLDVYAERVRRAPMIFQKAGCEWLWRTLCQPARIKRLPSLFFYCSGFFAEKCKKTLAMPMGKRYNSKK